MKTFVKWSGKAGIMFSLMFIFLFITGQVKIGIWKSILTILIGSILLGGFLYLIEEIYFPIRKKKMLKKVLRIFNAEQLSESEARFKAGKYDITVRIDFILSLSKNAANGEVISFHVPRSQLQSTKLDRPLSQIHDSLNDKLTYKIYQTNGLGLNLAKRRIDKRLL